jgi:hypothetical protein
METHKLLFKQFVKKAVVKTIIFIAIMVIITAFVQAITPVISNDVAMGQLENSDELFVMMEMYNKMKPLVDIAYILAAGLFMMSIGNDTYKFVTAIQRT